MFEAVENICLFRYLEIKTFVHFEHLPGDDGHSLF